MSKIAKALTAAAGNAGESLYVEDVFSTYLYSGTSATHDITNNVNLADEGGLVWIKGRSGVFSATNHRLFDTERGVYKHLATNLTSSEGTHTNTLTAFNTDGFTLGTDASLGEVNYTGMNYASWTFRKAEKFFDVVTYTGTGSTRSISHNLGSTPACIIIKSTSANGSWATWHNGIHSTSGASTYLRLNETAADTSFGATWISSINDTTFTVNNGYGLTNDSGVTYVAYLFASDAGGFGGDGSESIIKCGSFTLDGSGNASIDCGFEPQWVLAKRTDGAQDWYLTDMMRGMAQTTNGSGTLSPNLSDAEYMYNRPKATATGFDYVFTPNTSYIYIAIRRPMKTPESGTEVFAVDQGDASTTNPQFVSNFPVDLGIWRNIGAGNNWETSSRLQGSNYMRTNLTTAEAPDADIQWDFMTGFYGPARNTSFYSWMFKRATGFFDVVAYTGTGAAHNEEHNLGVAPEMMIVRSRSSSGNWGVYHASITNAAHRWIKLNDSAGLQTEATPSIWNDTAPTESVFSVCASTASDASVVNSNGVTYIAYLFASVAGVSKVGSYTGTGSNVDVDCGFSAGARFILIKRTDSTGDWYVYDSVRGIVAGNDPYLLLNSTAAEVTTTDYIDPLASGFTVTSTAPAALNASGGTYIFLAIA